MITREEAYEIVKKYVKNKNLFLDVNVIFRTIKVILTGEGAH